MSEQSIQKENVPERRKGPADRRMNRDDRRNAERVADELAPRRNPELPDRRKG